MPIYSAPLHPFDPGTAPLTNPIVSYAFAWEGRIGFLPGEFNRESGFIFPRLDKPGSGQYLF